ncbi:MAG TPA: alpha/beta fold hydrolase [Longimicrobium sp.]|nr:alpha/beta fold hydrolase [Longimicrobium sp.]
MRIPSILCAALALLAFPVAAQSARPQQHTVVVDGHPLAVWEKSPESAPRGAILLIHGATWSSLPNWDLQVPGEDRSVMDALVRAGYAAYALDQRGYGATPRDSTGWHTPGRAVEDANAVLRWIAGREGGARPAVVGYSLGSYVALLTAQRHPESLSAIVLYASPIDPDTPFASSGAPPAAPPRRPTTAEAAASDFITPGAASRAVVDAYVRQALASDPVKADWRRLGEFSFDLPSVRVPVLLLHGVHDPLATVERQARVFSRLGTEDRAWVILPASDHAAHVENAQAQWVHAIVRFLEQPRSSQGDEVTR